MKTDYSLEAQLLKKRVKELEDSLEVVTALYKKQESLTRRAIFAGIEIGAYAEDVTSAEDGANEWLKKNLIRN